MGKSSAQNDYLNKLQCAECSVMVAQADEYFVLISSPPQVEVGSLPTLHRDMFYGSLLS